MPGETYLPSLVPEYGRQVWNLGAPCGNKIASQLNI